MLLGRRLLQSMSGILVLGICFVYTRADVNDIPIWQWNARPLGAPLEYWLILSATILALPFAYYFSKQTINDRLLGELSFPLYLCHFLIIDLSQKYLAPAFLSVQQIGIFVLASALIVSALIVFFIEHPIDKLRHAWFAPHRNPELVTAS
jgi:peptidoglycan/LPS O-acetylase OafA/YrhL